MVMGSETASAIYHAEQMEAYEIYTAACEVARRKLDKELGRLDKIEWADKVQKDLEKGFE